MLPIICRRSIFRCSTRRCPGSFTSWRSRSCFVIRFSAGTSSVPDRSPSSMATPHASLRSLNRAGEALRNGVPLMVFPEGGRSATGQLQAVHGRSVFRRDPRAGAGRAHGDRRNLRAAADQQLSCVAGRGRAGHRRADSDRRDYACATWRNCRRRSGRRLPTCMTRTPRGVCASVQSSIARAEARCKS